MPINVEYLVVGGGGGGGSDTGGGGGAGGFLTGTASKAFDTTFTVTVGAGGTGGNYPTDGTDGGNSVFDNVTATGGGRGMTETFAAATGGSGGGGAGGPGLKLGAAGTVGQGNAGGNGSGVNPSTYGRAGGGGGADAAGANAGVGVGGAGGAGKASSITGSSVTYAGGGGGGAIFSGNGGAGGAGGGGAGGNGQNAFGTAGTANTGGGGGGASNDTGGVHESGGNGGSGVVILKFLDADTKTPTVTGSPTITTSGSYKVYKFTASGSISFSDPNVSIAAGTTTNISIVGKNATISVGVGIEVSAEDTNIAIEGHAPTLTIVSNPTINPTVTNIDIEGHSATLSIQGHIQVGVDVSNIDIESLLPQIEVGQLLYAVVTNIAIAGKNALNLYPSLVTGHNPVHYFRFLTSDTSSVTDYGSIAIYGSLYNVNLATDLETGIFGDPVSSGIRFDGVQGSSAQAIRWPAQNIWNTNNLLELNGAIEFWFKTSSPDVALLSMDNTDGGNPINQKTAYVGLVNGELGFRYSIQISPDTWAFIGTGLTLNDNEWHHVIMTKSYNSTTHTFTNKSYVDAEETPVVLSLSTFLLYNVWYGNKRMIGAYGQDSGDQVAKPFNYSLLMDELAIYSINLTQQDANDHYLAGSGINDVQIEPTVTDITVDQTTSNVGTVVFAESSDIEIKSLGVAIGTGAAVTIVTTLTDTVIEGINPSLANTGSRIIYQQTTDTVIAGKQNRVRVGDVFFKFISAQDTALSANDAETLESLDFGGLLFNQTKKLLFRIGNQEDNPTDFNITITSKESIVENAVQLSIDNITYESSVIIEQLPPNQISSIIYVKLDVNALDDLGNGTFLINVEKI